MFKFRASYKAALLILIATSGTLERPAIAGTYCAGGAVTSVNVGNDGGINASITNVGSDLRLCSISATSGSWTPDACRGLYGMITSAMLSGKKVSIYLADGQSCSQCPLRKAV
jgi:hypothetical protein